MQKDRVTSKRCPLTSSLRHTVRYSDGCKLSNSYRNPRSSCCRAEDLDHSTVEPRMYSTQSRDICMQKGSSTRGGVTAQRSALGRVTSFCGNSMNPFQGQGHCQQLPYFPYQAPPLKEACHLSDCHTKEHGSGMCPWGCPHATSKQFQPD